MLAVADGLDLPEEVVTSSNAILAVKRAGWSRTSSGPAAAVRVLEKLGLARRDDDGRVWLDEQLRA